MTDYTKSVEALRCGNDGKLPCDNKECPYWVDQWHGIGLCNVLKKQSDAADAIEALLKDNIMLLELRGDKMPKRGEWVEENRRPRSSQFVCSECHRTAYDPQPTRDKAWKKRCRYAYCPNCGGEDGGAGMSECVVRMEMPNGCYDCRLRNMVGNCPIPMFDDQDEEKIWTLEECFQRPPWCPIICQLPEEHGRLGDLDELAAGCDDPYWCRWLSEIEDAPTIVPAERSET